MRSDRPLNGQTLDYTSRLLRIDICTKKLANLLNIVPTLTQKDKTKNRTKFSFERKATNHSVARTRPPDSNFISKQRSYPPRTREFPHDPQEEISQQE